MSDELDFLDHSTQIETLKLNIIELLAVADQNLDLLLETYNESAIDRSNLVGDQLIQGLESIKESSSDLCSLITNTYNSVF